MRPVMLVLFQMMFFVAPVRVLGQAMDTASNTQRGSETVKPYKIDPTGQIVRITADAQGSGLLAKLPSELMKYDPKLLAIKDFNGDGREEIFVGWTDPPAKDYVQHFQIYQIGPKKDGILIREFQVEGGPVSWIEFPVAPKGRKINLAIAVVMGGGKWSTYYVIRPDGESNVTLGDGASLQLRDLDADGNYEWILLQWRGSELFCSYGFFGSGYSADIYRLTAGNFTKIWPPSEWAFLDGEIEGEILFGQAPLRGFDINGRPIWGPWKPVPWGKTYLRQNSFCDVDDDGCIEIAAITDVVSPNNRQPRLSIYKFRGDQIECAAQFAILSPHVAVQILGTRNLKDRKQIVVRLADANRCNEQHRYDKGVLVAAGIDLIQGRMSLSWVNDGIDISFWGEVQDVDNDGEEEMIFRAERTGGLPQGTDQKAPLLLKGVRDFLSYSAKKIASGGKICP